ncbi:MAG TPA: hypothetical protein VGQ81_15700 [Acidobacteriota bacterium]|jgi:hypothetical protein|nr:hypothetical protein [Acidobacteriota bacterium]
MPQLQTVIWIVAALLLGAGIGSVLRWTVSVRRSQARVSELEKLLAEAVHRYQQCERAIDEYYIPQWRDATERLAESPICTCPPYPYRSSCLRHSPGRLKDQIEILERIEQKTAEPRVKKTRAEAHPD